jgi:predicted AAA+ superfamily ATPase
MIQREITTEILDVAKEYNVVTILGPRQSGKTTLAKECFPDYSYVNLEEPESRKFAGEDPKAFLDLYKTPLILDEIQKVPELLSYIQVYGDKSNKPGEYILTGSHQPRLHEAISQSLAGRTAILNLLPFSISELRDFKLSMSWADYVYRGFLPRLYDRKMKETRFYRNYFQTYVERDVRQMINVNSLIAFENFMRLLAGRVGQVLNLSSLSNDVGVSSTTLKEWLSVLEASFIIYKLPPYFKNIGKQVIKSPKIYFMDTGLLCYLLGITSSKQVLRDSLRGSLFENLVIIDLLKRKFNYGEDAEFYFFRDSKGHEVDLIIEKSKTLIPVEIKSAMTFSNDFFKGIKFFQKHNNDLHNGFVVYNGDLTPTTDVAKVINLNNISEILGRNC